MLAILKMFFSLHILHQYFTHDMTKIEISFSSDRKVSMFIKRPIIGEKVWNNTSTMA